MQSESNLSNTIKTLIIEDDDAYALLLSRMLGRAKYSNFIIDRVGDLESASKYISCNKIDVILLDLYLPDGYGFDMLDAIRASVFNIPVIVLTSLDDEETGITALQKGAQDYLVKSHVNDDSLARSMRHAIERYNLLAKLRRKTKDLEASEERFRHITEQNVDAIAVVNNDGVVNFVNPAAESLFGRKSEDFISKPFDFKIYSGMEIEVEIQKEGEQPIIAEMRTTKIDWHGKDAYLVSLRDITERKQVEKFKEEVISIVSHELRSPITSIMNSLSLLADGEAGEIPEQAQKLINVARRSCERMLRLTNDMLDVKRIESGNVEFNFQPYELIPLIESSIEANYAYAEQFRVKYKLESHISNNKVYVDNDRLIQIMTNLLTNAAKFSPPDSEVNVSVSHNGEFIRVAVKDNGAGIPDEFHSRIFDKFTQAQIPGSRRRDGSGLGLSITKMLVEQMGGNIGFETKINEGTTFFFDLPEYHESQPTQ